MMDKYISSRAARTVFKVPVREQKKMSHTMTRYSKQTRNILNIFRVIHQKICFSDPFILTFNF